MLDSIDSEGNMAWHCTVQPVPGGPLCGAANTAHISHDAVVAEETDGGMVYLPVCGACGGRVAIRVAFTDSELAPPVIHHDSTGRIIQVEVRGHENMTLVKAHIEGGRLTRIDDVAWHPCIAQHLEAGRQLSAL